MALPATISSYAIAPVLAWLVFAVGCEGPPSANSLSEWKPSDHHSADDDKARVAMAQAGIAQDRKAAPSNDVSQLVELMWRQQCTTCHGAAGKGDGQMGPLLHVRDLTSSDWQSKTTDAEIAATIKNGKNKMPKFDLPEPVLAALVARVRGLRGDSQ